MIAHKKWRALEEGGDSPMPADRSGRPRYAADGIWLEGGTSNQRVPEPFAPI